MKSLSKRVSRLLGMFLAVVLTVGMLPAAAFAEVRASEAVTGKTFTETSTLTNGQYVIVSGGVALDQTAADTYDDKSGNSTYRYDGFVGVDVNVSGGKITSTVYEDMIWEVKSVSGGYTIESITADGDAVYLNGTYGTSSNVTHGVLGLSKTAGVWAFSGGKLSTSTSGGTKYISNDDSQYNNRFDFYTMRSSGSTFKLYKVENASGENPGQGSGGNEGTEPEGPSVTPDADGKILIVSKGYAMTTDEGKSYSNTGSSSSQKYNYTGFAGKKYTEGMTVTDDMLWETEDAGNGYLYIKHGDQYLNGSYVDNNSGGKDGSLTLGAKGDKWIWEGSLLKSNNSTKYLTVGNAGGNGDSNSDTFSVRSESNATDIEFIEVASSGEHKHSGGTATCSEKATCSSCGEKYGEFNANNHDYKNGVCDDCGAVNPNYVAPSGDATYVAFSSDVHNSSNSATSGSAGRLNNWVNNVSAAVGSSFDTMVFCGDSGDANKNGDTFWNLVQIVMDVVSANSNVADDGVFINGNHEFQNGSQGSTSNATAKKIKNIGDVIDGGDYLIYVFGARSTSQGFNSSDITALGNWLNSTPEGKPIFVVSHFPLHKNGSRDSENKASVISTLNAYSDKHEIYFLWGHNHTNSDSKYDEVITESLDGTQIGFTYMSAGCMSDSEYSNGSAYVKGKGLVAKIVDGTVVSLTYYAENASVVYTYTPDQSGTPDVDPDNPDYEGKIVIVGNGYALTTAAGESYSNTGSTNDQKYNYTGLAGKKYTEGMALTEDMLWEIEDAGNGYFYIKHGDQYLNGTYASNSTGGYDGSLSLGAKSDKWIWEDGLVKSYNASQTDKGAKYLTHGNSTQSGSNVNTFTVRSLDYANESTTFVEIESDTDCAHSGGTATCSEKATCSKCGEKYGELNASNHAGGTEVRDATDATCGEAGYTGDTYCLGCGTKTVAGKTVAATGNHDYEDGVCTECGAEDPDYGVISAVTIEVAEAVYTGSAQQPILTIKDNGVVLVEDVDYLVSSKAQTEAGTYEFTVVGIGDYEGEATGKWTIDPAEISSVEGLAIEDRFVATGSSIKPTLILSLNGFALVQNVDYTVAYEDNVNPGTASIIVTGLGNFAGTTEVSFEILPTGEWVVDPSGSKYKNPDGTFSVDCWQEIDGERYHFSATGYAQTGWLKDAGAWYYLKASGAMASSEWVKVGGSWYHFADDGVMQTGWLKDADTWYYLKASGAMASSEWVKVGGSWYHFAASGAMETGWLKDAGSWYYLKASGAMASSEWVKVGSDWYYFNGSGVMQASKWIGDYYVLSSGKMATSQWVGSYYVGADGKWIPNYRTA